MNSQSIGDVVITYEGAATPDAQYLIQAMYDDLTPLYGGNESGGFRPLPFDQAGGFFVVARVDGALAGCGGVIPFDAAAGEVKRIFVAHDFRGRGIARAIMADLEQRARAYGYRSLRLETGIKQGAAIGLYEAIGYERVACWGDYAGDPTSVCFEKLL
jgi:putative acetyltransferase